ncbi:Spermidine synthase [Serratia rubidaea]|uniref:Spermidine synthase n=1 Tax=Serratia rubidaea TaxID=61652 RepID=A0A4V6JI50_SERRU|nr:Spermidine synthase [Serratia rubidaea]
MAQKEIWYETLHDSFGQYFTVEKELYREKPNTRIW